MYPELEILQNTLKTAGCSLTTARRTVFEALLGHEPQTMADVITSAKSVDRASVYRIIELFEKLGIAHRLQIGWKYKLELSDQFSKHHHHLTCLNCGKVVALPENAIFEDYIRAFAIDYGFELKDHQLEVRGLCAECRIKK